jgi:hypothetical protein
MELLDNPALNIPHKQHTRKVFRSLYALVKIIPEIEKRTNTVISCLRSGIWHEEGEAIEQSCGLACKEESG